MPICPACGNSTSPEARFCGNCGADLPQEQNRPLPPRDLRSAASPAIEWLSLDDVIYTRDRRFGGIGTILAFFGAFSPWATTSVGFLGLQMGSYGVSSPQAWLIALAAIAAGIFLFRPKSASVVMVIGIVLAAWTLLFVITTLSGHNSPSWGVILTLAGGGLLAYSGHLTKQYEQVS